jgi:hypothetical protein
MAEYLMMAVVSHSELYRWEEGDEERTMMGRERNRELLWGEDDGEEALELGRVAMAMELLSTAEDAWTHSSCT